MKTVAYIMKKTVVPVKSELITSTILYIRFIPLELNIPDTVLLLRYVIYLYFPDVHSTIFK